MTRRIGENIQSEWDAEPHAGELWDALEALKKDREAGIEMLTALATGGSALAMTFLGHAHASSSDPDADWPLGEQWLIRATEAESIEGRYILAGHYMRQDLWEKALSEMKGLADQGYAPAMYVLGRALYVGEDCERSVPSALTYLRRARDAGHLPALALLSLIYRKERFGLRGLLASHWLCLKKIPAIAWQVWRYPSSDRLRGDARLEAALGRH